MNFLRRLTALVKKEFLQLIRDNSSILIGAVLPLVLILIMGYGISLDVKNVPVAVVMEDFSPTAKNAVSFLDGSEYFSPRYVRTFDEGKNLMQTREVDAIIVVPVDFTKNLANRTAKIQVILYGVNNTTATAAKGYIEAGISSYNAQFYGGNISNGVVTVENRIWFNDANSSTWYFVPGLIMLISTLVGIFLTALVMAREWERGTLESIFVTPVKIFEILLSKIIPYFCVAMFGFLLCLLAARYLYSIPLHGSILVLFVATILYLFVALGIGLVISTVTKSQFLSCQVALIVGFMPSLMLTGFIFDLHSAPDWVNKIGHVLPPTYYLELLKSLFLAGNNWELIFKNCTILILYAVFFMGIALKITRKRIE